MLVGVRWQLILQVEIICDQVNVPFHRVIKHKRKKKPSLYERSSRPLVRRLMWRRFDRLRGRRFARNIDLVSLAVRIKKNKKFAFRSRNAIFTTRIVARVIDRTELLRFISRTASERRFIATSATSSKAVEATPGRVTKSNGEKKNKREKKTRSFDQRDSGAAARTRKSNPRPRGRAFE